MKEKAIIELIKSKHLNLFGKKEAIAVRSPGRINLIGEHTDYNDGFVFPAAINKAIYFTASENDKGLFRFYSIDLDEDFEMEVSKLSKSNTVWANYLLGVADQFIKSGCNIRGIDCVFGGDIPIGAGLSSSAAIETGFAMVLNDLFGCNKTKLDMVKMAQKAEHEYAGVMCGIMDQFATMYGRSDSAIKLDCRTLEYEYAAIDLKDYKIVLCDTKVKHSLASSEYNMRRKECEMGVQILKKYNNSISALRDVDLNFLESHKEEFDPTVFKRCKYVIEENKRVIEAFKTLNDNNIVGFGKLMFQSHKGLRDEYEVSCRELDILVEIARSSDEVIGARMMGGGFGGCTINIVKKEETESFSQKIIVEYKKATGIIPEIYIVRIVDGTGTI